jgi:hypothetical protein
MTEVISMVSRPEGPDFVGVGVQKSGSTWLADILAQHPKIIIPRKEIHFFNRYFYQGYSWYNGWFANKRDRVAGDFTPRYFITPSPAPMSKEFYPHWNLKRIILYRNRKASQPDFVVQKERLFEKLYRIFQFWFQKQPSARDELKIRYPGIRVLAIFRNPVDRAWSAYWDWRGRKDRKGERFVSFDKLWSHDGRWIQTHGLYASHLSYWRGSFPDFGVFFYDDIKKDPLGLARSVYGFIGVDDTFVPEISRQPNKGEYNPMPVNTRKMLVNFYREQILEFSAMTGRDLNDWLKVR